MSNNYRQDLQSRMQDERTKNRNYLVKSFDDFRNELLQYAVTYFPDKINDFSATSLGGMLLDFASIVGDTLSFYMDHQFNELDPSTATENENILKHIRKAGIQSSPPSPSTVLVDFKIKVDLVNGNRTIKRSQLPKILKNTRLSSGQGINFSLLEDLDFSDNNFKKIVYNENQQIAIITKEGLCVSGNRTTESFVFGNSPGSFPLISLSNGNINMIEKVYDDENNEYYEVEYLSQDTIYKSIKNNLNNERYYEIIPATRRFVKEENLLTGEVNLRFGGGSNQNVDENILIDPTKAALSLYGREYFSKLTFDPGQLLKTNSLGIAPKNTTVYVSYRYGGGLNHNIPLNSIEDIIDKDNIIFSDNATEADIIFIKRNISVENPSKASGGTDGLSFADLQQNIPNAMKMQNRIVNYQDLLGRLYSMPAPLGRISKATIVDNKYDFFNKNLYVLSKDNENYLTICPDALKKNISTYINEYRLIGDSFTILDGIILNFGINIKVRIREGYDPIAIKNSAIERIIRLCRFDLYQIGQPIILDDIYNIVINTPNIYSIASEKKDFITSVTGIFIPGAGDPRTEAIIYSNNSFNPITVNYNDVLYPPTGAIFEMKYPEYNINIQIVT
jgi:hypothetical protein